MKLTGIIGLALAAWSVQAQLTENQRLGAFTYGSRAPLRENGIQPIASGAPTGAVTIQGRVVRAVPGLVLVSVEMYSGGAWSRETVAITNYPGAEKLVTGRMISANARPVDGPLKDGVDNVELFEHLDLQQYRQKLNQKRAEQAAQQAELNRQQREQAALRAKELSLKANLTAAERGDAYGLLRMGERYRDGDGVPKDLARAKDYFQRAADAGSDTARAALDKLNTP